MKLAAARASALLSLLFLACYGTTNWITAHRAGVGTLYFDWERWIPFVPIFIVPYLSLDLFFLGAPFLCRTPGELRVYSKRVAFAIVAACACFLLLPLRFAFDRPPAAGWLGAVFDAFRGFDQPHNLVPSLHIALQMIVGGVYLRHARGLLRAAIFVWFVLIGVSTLLTYQHHVLDLAGGFGLAVICFYLFRESPVPARGIPNPRVGAYYAAGCLAVLPLGGFGIWPAIAMGLMALAYFRLGPAIYRKEQGRLPLSAKLLLAPCVLGQQVSLLYYRRRCAAWNEVVSGVLVGRVLSHREAASVCADAVLDLTAEFSEAKPFLSATYRNIPVLDLTAPSASQLREGVAFIAEESVRGRVYVHCKIGYSRSAAVIGAYLIASEQAATPDEAVAMLRAARPTIVIRPEAMSALRGFAATWSPKG